MGKSGFQSALANLSDLDRIRQMRLKLDDALRPFIPLDNVFNGLGSLLAGGSEQPIHLIHSTLHTFLVDQANTSAETARFTINEQNNSQELAFLCLRLLNQNIDSSAPYVGYSEREIRGIPRVENDVVTEPLWYACNFWTVHFSHVDKINEKLLCQLEIFLSDNFVSWVEIICAINQYTGISFLQNFKEVRLPYLLPITVNLQ